MILYLVLLIVLLLYKAGFSGPENFQEDHFSKSYELPLRGFFTVVILFHHLSQYLENPGVFFLFREVGILCVAVFFFYSGYGVMKSVLTSRDYFRHYFVRRFSSIFIPFFLCNIIYLTVYTLNGARYGLLLSAQYLSGIRLINPQSWYIIVIALFYFVFYLCFRWIKKPFLSILLLGIFQILFPTYCMAKGPGIYWFQGEWWFNSSSLFLIGVLMARAEGKIISFSKKRYYPALLASACIFLYFYPKSIQVLDKIEPLLINEHIFVREMLENWVCFLWQTLAVISFVVFLFFLTMKLRFSNKILIFLGQRSFDLYLIHGLFLELFRNGRFAIQNDFFYTMAVLICSLAASALMYYPFRFAAKKLPVILTKRKE